MQFIYDNNKSKTNKIKHGISFEEAKELWSAPYVELKARIIDEPRFMIIGKINGKCYSCVYTVRDGSIRLISVRRSRKSEEEIYYGQIQA